MSPFPSNLEVCGYFPSNLGLATEARERQYTELGIRASGPCSSAVEEQADFGEKWSDSGNSAPKAMRG